MGELRFRPPVAYNASWDCVRDGTLKSEDKTCPQVGLFNDTIRSNEDCLYLDVFVPESSGDIGLLPVLVWIHGGGYIAGAGTSDNYSPLFYMSHQVIVVEVRLDFENENVITVRYLLTDIAWVCWASSPLVLRMFPVMPGSGTR